MQNRLLAIWAFSFQSKAKFCQLIYADSQGAFLAAMSFKVLQFKGTRIQCSDPTCPQDSLSYIGLMRIAPRTMK